MQIFFFTTLNIVVHFGVFTHKLGNLTNSVMIFSLRILQKDRPQLQLNCYISLSYIV